MSEHERTVGDREAGPRGARVEATRLTRTFGDRAALSDVNLTIERGESFGLLGANGAGKTTFIRLVTGYLLPTEGRITVDGLSSATQSLAVQERIGFVPENSRLYPELRVGHYLRFAGGIRGLSGAVLDTAVERALTRFQLEDSRARPIGNLSKGFQQRVSLAQAFLHEPRLLIVDEPTSGLDPLQQEEVRSALASLCGHCTVLLCTHDLSEARELTQRSAVLSAGHLVACGATDDVLSGDDPLRLFRAPPDSRSDSRSDSDSNAPAPASRDTA